MHLPIPSPSGALRARVLLPSALGAVSAAALLVEIVAGRLLAPYVGMSLYTWTAIIAVVLAGLSAGHWLGGVLDPGDRHRSYRRLAGALALAALTTALVPVLVRVVSGPLLGTGLAPLAAISALVAALFLAPSLFAGVVSPILTRLALDDAPAQRSRVLGRMFAAGALGSIAGTLLAGFVLIPWVGTLRTLLGVALVEAALAAAFFAAARPPRTVVAGSAAACAGLAIALLAATERSGALTSPCTVESGYFCIRVVDYAPQSGRASRLMVLDHMGHGISDRDEPRWLHASYTALTDRLLRARGIAAQPFSAFFIGGGAYTVPRAWLHAFPGARITVAELDPQVTAVARERFWLRDSPRLRTLHGDARWLLDERLAGERFDAILGDAFHDLSVPAHLTTVEFARLVHARLADGGVYLLHVLDSAAAPRFLLAQVRTLLEVFATVEVWVDEGQWRGGGRISYLLVAAAHPSPASFLRGASPDDLDAGRAWRRLPGASVHAAAAAPGVPLLADDHAPVDRLMFPVLEKDL